MQSSEESVSSLDLASVSTSLLDGSKSRRRLHSLTGLRFPAALGVLLYHGEYLVHYPFHFGSITSAGQAGVSLFFLLSGFILYYQYHHRFYSCVNSQDYQRFLRARFARIYPMHLVALLLITPIALLTPYLHAGAPPRDMTLSWIFNLLLIQIYLPRIAMQNLWNGPSWSLANEIVFYAVFPFFCAGVLRRFRKDRSLILFASGLYLGELALFLIVSSIGTAVNHTTVYAVWIVRTPLLRIDEFFIGCILGALYLSGQQLSDGGALRALRSEKMRNFALLLCLITALALFLVRGPMTRGSEVLDLLYCHLLFAPISAILILCLAFGPTVLSRLLEHPWIVLLGEASYSIYILHWIPYSFLLDRRLSGMQIGIGGLAATILSICVVSIYAFRWIEAPARRALRG